MPTGRSPLRPGLIGKQAEIAEDLADLAGHRSGTRARSSRRRASTTRSGRTARFLREKLFKLEAGDSDELHRQLLAEIRDLGAHVGDTSNLILDPDLDSYYLMDAILIKLPRGQDLLAQASSLGKKSIVTGKTPTVEERTEFIRLAGLLRSNREATRTGAGRGVPEQPRGQPESQPGADRFATTWPPRTRSCTRSTAKSSGPRRSRSSRTTMTGSSSKAWKRTIPSGTGPSSTWTACCRPASTGLPGRSISSRPSRR